MSHPVVTETEGHAMIVTPGAVTQTWSRGIRVITGIARPSEAKYSPATRCLGVTKARVTSTITSIDREKTNQWYASSFRHQELDRGIENIANCHC